ncbi:MAG: bifunctional metallophosphatase/5'-nucleotidase [Bacteroidales bacterium]|nr:bifunctional metallophosphatase/5'-nucleotidase [Bacteroidales bacterium]
MKIRKSIMILTALGLFLMGCKQKAKEVKMADPTGEIEVNILAVNDMHSSIDQFPKFATMVDSLRTIYPELLVFSAGDNRTGNPVNDQFDPVNYPMIALMNEVGFDVSAVGNHEWDANVGPLQNDIERAHFPFLCANVFIPETLNLDIKPYVVLENQGIKLAVVGMIEVRHDDIPGTHPDNLTKVRFKNAKFVLPDYKYLKKQSNAVILLSHCGFEDDMELAQACPWLDAIIGGHSHTLVEHPSETNGVLITQSGSHLKHATLVTLKFKDGKLIRKNAKVLNVNGVRRSKPEVKKMLDGFNDAPALNEAIATALTKFENPEEIGCMMTDAFREVSGADFAFQNTGGVRVNYLKKGPITVKDVYSMDPFNNEIVVFQMTGSQVKHFILNSYRKNGGYPSYVSGMNYVVSDDGKNVWVEMDGAQFSTKTTYKVAFNSYMASTIDVRSVDDGQSTFKTSEEMIIEFLKRKKTVDYQGVSRTR